MGVNEEVVIVDRQNQVIGNAFRPEMRSRKLIRRASYILVFNTRGYLFIQLEHDFTPDGIEIFNHYWQKILK